MQRLTDPRAATQTFPGYFFVVTASVAAAIASTMFAPVARLTAVVRHRCAAILLSDSLVCVRRPKHALDSETNA
jgi:hypothetical protein